MRLPARVRSLTRRRALAIVGAAVVVLAATIVVAQPNDETRVDLTAGESGSTADDATTTSTDHEATSTTASTTTTTQTTTTAPSTTLPPPTAPPTTSPPPPPPPPGPLDMSAVLAFAKAGVGAAVPPVTAAGPSCPAYVKRPSDAGDDTVLDIGDWYLARYCDGVYRAGLGTMDEARLDSAWIEADTKAGGCSGIDFVVIGWHTSTGGSGAVVATPGCDQASWRWVDAAGFPVWSLAWFQLDFRSSALGDPGSFHWRGAVRAPGESGAVIDMVPNGGPEHFVV